MNHWHSWVDGLDVMDRVRHQDEPQRLVLLISCQQLPCRDDSPQHAEKKRNPQAPDEGYDLCFFSMVFLGEGTFFALPFNTGFVSFLSCARTSLDHAGLTYTWSSWPKRSHCRNRHYRCCRQRETGWTCRSCPYGPWQLLIGQHLCAWIHRDRGS